MKTKSFIRLVAKESNYTLKDTYAFYYAFLKVFSQCASELEPLELYGFGKLDYIIFPERQGNNPEDIRKRREDPNHPIEKVTFPETIKVVFRLATSLRDRIRENLEILEIKDNIDDVDDDINID
jgi:nucleoid DNA-binding protein